MCDTENEPIGNGLFKIPNSARPISNKVYDLFTKMKKKVKDANSTASNSAPGQPVRDVEPNLNELGESAMNSYRIRDEVVKMENGFEVE
jgi:hypothetical protein